jgi:hypothetical protein
LEIAYRVWRIIGDITLDANLFNPLLGAFMTAATALMHNHTGGFALQRDIAHNFSRNVTKPLHVAADYSAHSSVTPFQRHQKYDVENAVANTTKDRTFKQPAPIDKITERQFAQIVSDALQAHYGPMKGSAKCCANDAGASVATAKNWLSGLCPPSSVYLKRLESKVPGLAAEMRRLTAMEAEQSADFQQQLSLLMTMLQQIELP